MESNLITRDKDILGGVPVFAGTRVPVNLDEFFEIRGQAGAGNKQPVKIPKEDIPTDPR